MLKLDTLVICYRVSTAGKCSDKTSNSRFVADTKFVNL